MIRRFDQLKDLERAMVLLEQLRRASEYRGMVPAWDRVINTLAEKGAGKGGVCFVADDGKVLHGLLLGQAAPLWWADQSTGPKIATDLLFTSVRYGAGHALVGAFKDWALAQPRIARIEMALSGSKTDPAHVARMYERHGFVREGSFFVLNAPAYADMLGQMKEA